MAKEIQEKRAAREEQAFLWPVSGTVHSCVILDQEGKEVFAAESGFSTLEGEIGHKSMMALAQLLHPESPEVNLFGLRVRSRMRVMALDALRHRVVNPQADPVPLWLWANRAFENGPWADPHDVLIPSERRGDISWDCLCKFLGIDVPEGLELDTDARGAAEIARQLTLRGGIDTL